MAARKNKTELTQAWKDKIQASVIALRLYGHVQGEHDMSATQIKAAQILLAKLIPDLGRTELTGEDGGPIRVTAVEWSVVEAQAKLP